MTQNIAFAGAIADVANNGYFEFYDSSIFENYAYQTPLLSILDSRITSIISNCTIHSNFDLYDTWKSEIKNKCDKTCAVPEKLRNYYKKSDALLYLKIQSAAPLNVISSSLKLEDNTHFYNHDTMISIFLSDVEIVDCTIGDIKMTFSNFKVTSFTRILPSSSGKLGFVL